MKTLFFETCGLQGMGLALCVRRQSLAASLKTGLWSSCQTLPRRPGAGNSLKQAAGPRQPLGPRSH